MLIFILTLVQSAQLDKLELLQADTSKSTLAQGLEQFESTFSEFSSKLDSSLSRIFEEISSLNDLNRDMANSVIGSDIDELEHKQFLIMQKIRKIKKVLADDDKCSVEGNCDDCASKENCVWCDSESKCVKGDSDGPLSVQCDSFYYKTCPKKGCSRFLTCYTCLSDRECEWCASTLKCIHNPGETSNSCPDLEYYFKNAQGKTNCQELSSFSENPEFLPSNTFELLEKSIDRLYTEYSACESLIDLLYQAKSEIDQSYETSKKLKLTQAAFEPVLDGLAEEVKETQNEEINSEDREQIENAQDNVQSIYDEAKVDIDKNTDATVYEVREGQDDVTDELQDTRTGFGETMTSIDNSIKRIDSSLMINDKKSSN